MTAVADTSLWERQTDHNLGGADFLPVGTIGADGNESRSHLLLKFDVAGRLPPNAVVETGEILLHQVRSPGGGQAVNRRFHGYRVFFEWNEGNKDYTDPQTPLQNTQMATNGEATWTHRKFGLGGETWQTPGGGIDQDFGDDSEFEFFAQTGTDRDYSADLTFSGLDTVQAWLADPSSNFGWAIIVDVASIPFTARQLASRENLVAEFRPRLRIVYSLPGPEEPNIQSISKNGSSVSIVYSAEADVAYRPQFKGSLAEATWTDLPLQGPLAADGTLQFTDDLTGVDRRYYRIVVSQPPPP